MVSLISGCRSGRVESKWCENQFHWISHMGNMWVLHIWMTSFIPWTTCHTTGREMSFQFYDHTDGLCWVLWVCCRPAVVDRCTRYRDCLEKNTKMLQSSCDQMSASTRGQKTFVCLLISVNGTVLVGLFAGRGTGWLTEQWITQVVSCGQCMCMIETRMQYCIAGNVYNELSHSFDST